MMKEKDLIGDLRMIYELLGSDKGRHLFLTWVDKVLQTGLYTQEEIEATLKHTANQLIRVSQGTGDELLERVIRMAKENLRGMAGYPRK